MKKYAYLRKGRPKNADWADVFYRALKARFFNLLTDLGDQILQRVKLMNACLQKLSLLRKNLSKYQRAVIAFSGGVDSTLLLKVACEELAEVVAVTAVSETFTEGELELAKAMAAELNVEHVVVCSNEMNDGRFVANDFERCYYCKRIRFSQIKQIAEAKGIDYILDGSNIDDLKDFRPGRRALKELGVICPLEESGLSKKEIREISYRLGLPTWNLPAPACLATRIPYGDPITKDKLATIKAGEEFLKSLGFNPCRLRHHGNIARIEVLPNMFNALLQQSKKINDYLEKLGFHYITLDLAGLNSGSMNKMAFKF